MPPLAAPSIRVLDQGDVGLAPDLAALINRVYAEAEHGLWRVAAGRTSADEIQALICAGELAVATRDGRIVGSVRLHDVAPDTSEFGLLVAAPQERGTGVGSALVDFVEREARARGLREVQLELLVPRAGTHPSKEVLRAWYGRRGYRLVRTEDFAGRYPALASHLVAPCDLEVRRRALCAEPRPSQG